MTLLETLNKGQYLTFLKILVSGELFTTSSDGSHAEAVVVKDGILGPETFKNAEAKVKVLSTAGGTTAAITCPSNQLMFWHNWKATAGDDHSVYLEFAAEPGAASVSVDFAWPPNTPLVIPFANGDKIGFRATEAGAGDLFWHPVGAS